MTEKAPHNSFNFTERLLEQRQEQLSSSKSKREKLREDIRRLRRDATDANYAVIDLKGHMSRAHGSFVIAYRQSADEMRKRVEAIRGELQLMRASLQETKTLDPDDHAHDHDHHEDEAHLNHMDAHMDEIERASHFTRGRAGLHILQTHHNTEHGRRHGYTTPIEHDLHFLQTHERPVARAGNDDMKLGRSLDAIAHDFDRFNEEMDKLKVKHIGSESRFKSAGDRNPAVA